MRPVIFFTVQKSKAAKRIITKKVKISESRKMFMKRKLKTERPLNKT